MNAPPPLRTTRTLEASAFEPVTIYYCKAGIPTGQTVRVQQGSELISCRGTRLFQASAEMIHGNPTGKAKASGARCVLILHAGYVHILD